MFAIFGERRVSAVLKSGKSPHAVDALALIDRGARAHPALGVEARSRALDRLIGSGAWTDAALALVDRDLPSWRLRRLELDGSEWVCTLSRSPQLPSQLDDTADGRDRLIALAILDAFAEAQRRSVTSQSSRAEGEIRNFTTWTDDVFR